MVDLPYLYRGTTVDWPGNPGCLQEGITCTATDPLVATLFAVECRNHGSAIVLGVRKGLFEVDGTNPFAMEESAVNLLAKPIDVLRGAEMILEADRALEILRDLGIADIPIRISGKWHLDQAIHESFELGQRLSPHQIGIFDTRALTPGGNGG